MRWLVPEWKMLTLKSYTAWAFYMLALLTVSPDLIYAVFEVDTNPVVWTTLQIVTIIAGILGRLVLQPDVNKWRRRAIIAAITTVCVLVAFPALASPTSNDDFDQEAFELISRWEGKRNHSYQDIVGVWTICYGHTRTAGPGQYKNDYQCKRLLQDEIVEYRSGLHAYLTEATRLYRLPPKRDAAYTSLAFNVGIRAAGKSTATRRLNRADIKGGCNALSWWNRAGGRVVRGLVRRRSAERELCLWGLK